MKIGVIGDIHFKESLGYADYVKDRRLAEKQEVLGFIVKSFEACDTIVFLGDQLNSRNNSSEVIREFVEFVERFGDKQIYVLAGNHEKKGDGRSAIDFMKEVKKENWHIVTNAIEHHPVGDNKTLSFCPYFSKSEWGVETDSEGTKIIMDSLSGGEILFVHHAISDTMTTSGCQTNIFEEILLPKKELEKRYKLVIGGHIHHPQKMGNTIVAGSIFTNEIGETSKSIWMVECDKTDVTAQELKLPGRGIYKLENPTEEQLSKVNKNDIVKVILTEKKEVADVTALKEKLESSTLTFC